MAVGWTVTDGLRCRRPTVPAWCALRQAQEASAVPLVIHGGSGLPDQLRQPVFVAPDDNPELLKSPADRLGQ
ncbi:hypothetical protein JIG36_39505 [Actinoplanes sp. LDG1-06]|uniref:Fructose-bisphosphate aldolase n=1 Tax=Paractinoplanes ovalisporus TaxID=2810368 RepID=A0ABS2AQJ5_9ACTN|nr:hypothetical protein [Actinoplanes ovalisporus]MBM2621608.1 hypothetical protein [Actinoplanes ovalisporus]